MIASNDPHVAGYDANERMWRTPAFRDITQNWRIREGSLLTADLPDDLARHLIEHGAIRGVLL